jgi:hypothetical protein
VLLRVPYAKLYPGSRPTELFRFRSPPQPAQRGPSVRKLLTTNCSLLTRAVLACPSWKSQAVGCRLLVVVPARAPGKRLPPFLTAAHACTRPLGLDGDETNDVSRFLACWLTRCRTWLE